MCFIKKLIIIQIFVAISLMASGQDSAVKFVKANFITDELEFNGKLDEVFWQSDGIENFTQKELDYGQLSTEKTKVAVVYDNSALYFGIWCYMKNSNDIR